jgi:transposase
VFDVMTRLKIHNMADGGLSQADISTAADVPLRTVQRVLAEAVPTRDDVIAGSRADAKRLGRPRKADEVMIERIRLLLADKKNAKISAIEVLRLARTWGFRGGRSQMTELVRQLRPPPSAEPIIRFEGLPGEYTQFDFGEVEIDFTALGKQRVQFFGGRLKYSRFMHVVVVPNQVAETLVRSLIACLVAFGGSTKEWVFDNPKTVRVSRIGVKPVVLHRYLGQLVAEYNVIALLCAPRSGNQKGSVERLVGFVKNGFFRQRTFRDHADLDAQLAEWLHDVNFVRPCDATGEIPAVARRMEEVWLAGRPVQVGSADWAIVATATVTPMGTIPLFGTSYSATARRLGAPATVHIRGTTLDVTVGDERCTHAREDHTGEVRRLPQHREDVLAVIHGQRKEATFRRQCLLELGQPAWLFLGQLIHLEPCGSWEGPCNDLFGLLQRHDDDAMRAAFAHCHAHKHYTVAAVRDALAAA